MSEQQIKHLEMIQAVITRMAANSFMLKGWSVTLVSALFALAAKDADARYVLVSYFPVAMFWFLDGYFLFQERLFRKLYDKARVDKGSNSDFSMNTVGLEEKEATWASAILSRTLLIFHGVIFLTVVVVMFVLRK